MPGGRKPPGGGWGEGRKEKENQKPSQPKPFAMITMIAKPMPDCRFSSAYFIKNSLVA